jgi:hypothetical protein
MKNMHALALITIFNSCDLNTQWSFKVMKSYIKIYGPPMLKSLRALEALAVDTPEVCIMDTIMAQELSKLSRLDEVKMYFFSSRSQHVGKITDERCKNIISKSGSELGEHDFYFEWFMPPTQEQINDLIQNVDDALSPLGAKYTITTKK